MNITIIAILAAIAIPAYMNFRDKARTATAKADLRNIQRAIEQLANDTSQWAGPREVGEVGTGAEWDLNAKAAGLVKVSTKFTKRNYCRVKDVMSESLNKLGALLSSFFASIA